MFDPLVLDKQLCHRVSAAILSLVYKNIIRNAINKRRFLKVYLPISNMGLAITTKE
jgi:hypothetical protein